MKTRILVVSIFFVFFITCAINTAYALEFEPLIAKNTDGVITSTSIVEEPIIFEVMIYNDEDDVKSFDVSFSTRTMRDKYLDQQTQSVNLKPGDTTTLRYQFTPAQQGNYVTGVYYADYYSNYRVADTITFPALDDPENYTTKTVRIYSDSSDDCLVACTDPSVMDIDIRTVVEWHNTSPNYRYISTGSYTENEDGSSWSSGSRFQSMIGPDRKSSFLFYQPGEYQFFLAEHRGIDVVGTINVLSDTFTESDRTLDILQAIMDDKDSEIPITSLHVNPKNSVITVGIDDRKNPLFTLDIYKTMLYKQVGNMFLNIVPDYTSTKEKLCDVNDAVKVRDSLNDDPVVRQFLKYYPSSTFEHFTTGDEPGNPRTYSEFRYGLFLLQILVLTHDESGACYPVYGYSIRYDDPKSDMRKDFFENISSESNTIQDAIDAVKDLSNPLKQHKFGIVNSHIKCKSPLVVLVKEHNQSPSCVTESTSSKLLNRGWMEHVSCNDGCESDIIIDKKLYDLFEPKITITGLNDFYDIFEPINFAITFESYGIDHGGYEIRIDGIDEKNNKEVWYEAKDVALPDIPPESFSHIYEFPRRDSNPIVFSKPGWYEVDFFVSDSERAKWNFRVQYNEQLDFTNNVQEFQDKLDSSMKYDDLVWTFGEPDNDIGSGIHIYVYDMDDGSKVLIGYGDYIWYAKHVDYNYNFMKDLFEENEN